MEYEDIEQGIESCPRTYLPALLAVAIKACMKEKVFIEGKLPVFVNSVVEKHSPPSKED